ncbi:MAG: hypothetical protein AMXMBFR64_62090 [Myxococcales bacterium]
MSDWLERTLRSWIPQVQRHGISDRTVFLILATRSAAAEAGMAYDTHPWLRQCDQLLLDRANEVVEAAGEFLRSPDGGAAPEEHWWWFLDEIQAGRRPRPEVG